VSLAKKIGEIIILPVVERGALSTRKSTDTTAFTAKLGGKRIGKEKNSGGEDLTSSAQDVPHDSFTEEVGKKGREASLQRAHSVGT